MITIFKSHKLIMVVTVEYAHRYILLCIIVSMSTQQGKRGFKF